MLNPLRKDLNIRGAIGEAGQKSKLTYFILVHQIKQAKLIGYTDQEIINAVISYVLPSLTPRTLSEATANLSSERLEQFFKAHFPQQNAHDLSNIISTMFQLYSFVVRCLEIRQKMFLFSGKFDYLSYTPQFVNKFFLRTLERGIRSLFIVQKIKHLPSADKVCDEDLLAGVMRTSTYENVRSTLQSQDCEET